MLECIVKHAFSGHAEVVPVHDRMIISVVLAFSGAAEKWGC